MKLIRTKIIIGDSPDEVDSKNGKDFYLKIDNSRKIKVGPSESMSKSKKIPLIQRP